MARVANYACASRSCNAGNQPATKKRLSKHWNRGVGRRDSPWMAGLKEQRARRCAG